MGNSNTIVFHSEHDRIGNNVECSTISVDAQATALTPDDGDKV